MPKDKNKKTELSPSEATRQEVAKFLPEAIEIAFKRYVLFIKKNIDTEDKSFAEHHAAGKAAASHLQLMVKLFEWLDGGKGDHAAMIEVMRQAVAETNDYRAKEFPE